MAANIKQRFGVQPKLNRSGGGVFEITVNGQLVYSKKATGRFPEEEEVYALLNEHS